MKRQQSTSSNKLPRWVIPVLVSVFLAVFYILTISGGQCTRYEQKMTRVQYMRKYIDSLRRKEQLEKLRHNQQDEAQPKQ